MILQNHIRNSRITGRIAMGDARSIRGADFFVFQKVGSMIRSPPGNLRVLNQICFFVQKFKPSYSRPHFGGRHTFKPRSRFVFFVQEAGAAIRNRTGNLYVVIRSCFFCSENQTIV